MPATDLSAVFLREICERPHDNDVRLIYADWLEDNGQSERAEFIRVQIELATIEADPTNYHSRCAYSCGVRECRRPSLLGRQRKLCPGDRWYPLWAEGDYNYYPVEWLRGFVGHIAINCADWLKHGCEIVQVHPITSVALRDAHVVTAIPHKSDGPYICVVRGDNGHADRFAYPWRDAVTVADPATEAVPAYGHEAIAWARNRAKLPPLWPIVPQMDNFKRKTSRK